MKSALIVGGDSLIGGTLRTHFVARAIAVDSTSRRPAAPLSLDLAAPADSWNLPDRYDVAILCAARARLQDCEEHPDETRRVNVTNTIDLARQLHDRGAFVIFLSTNLVFSGTSARCLPTDRTDPQCEYGRQKADAETGLLALGERIAVARLSKVIHRQMPLLQTWEAGLRRGEVIRPYQNLHLSPITPETVAHGIEALATRRGGGIHHLSAEGTLTYADLGRALAEAIGAAPALVQPQPAIPAPGPLAILDTTSTRQTLDLRPTTVEATLRELFPRP